MDEENNIINVRNIYIILCIILCIILSIMQSYIIDQYSALPTGDYSIKAEGFRAMNFGEGTLSSIFDYSDNINADPYEFIVVLMVDNKFDLNHVNISSYSRTDFVRYRNKILRKYPNEFLELKNGYKSALEGLTYFPIPKSTLKNKKDGKVREWINYVNSWGFLRTYGGERTHEGTDIMADENIRGVYPVLSISDGVVSNKGWLEKGGYRLGITTTDGAYLYYAHMASYAPDLKEGDKVAAGQFLGYMGDTGYSTVEGTTGNFAVHLHFGMYLNETTEEISINPYYILKYLENKILYYSY